MRKATFAALGLIGAVVSAEAQQFSADELPAVPSSGVPSKPWSGAFRRLTMTSCFRRC
jgi:hypothetical protein